MSDGGGALHGERQVSEQDGDFAGDPRSVDSADAGVGAAARVRAEQGDSHEFGGDPTSRYGFAVSGAAPAGACGMDQGGMEAVGGGATVSRVSADEQREAAVAARGDALGADYGGGSGRVASGEQGGRVMNWRWLRGKQR